MDAMRQNLPFKEWLAAQLQNNREFQDRVQASGLLPPVDLSDTMLDIADALILGTRSSELRELCEGFNPPRTIPEISDEVLKELAAKIKPVVKTEKGYKAIKPVDLKRIAFTWDPKTVGCTMTRLAEVGKITTYHNWAYYGFFKPSIAEVLAFVTPELVAKADFFWLDSSRTQEVGQPFLHMADLRNIDGYHRAEVTLLSKP